MRDAGWLYQCPVCAGGLTAAHGPPNEDIEASELRCPAGHVYPVLRGVPRFTPTEDYAGNFGFEWTLHDRTQLDDSTSRESEETFRAKTGFTPEELRGKTVLDVGCGMGRFADVASRWGAQVYAIDLSLAVESAQRNLGGRVSVHIAQASIFALPFAEEVFDFIFSIGVLHHTPDTRSAFERLPRLLKPGGKIAIWLYPRYDSVPSYVSDVLRKLTIRMPKRLLYAISHLAVPAYYLYRMPRLGLLPRSLLPLSTHPKRRWRVLDTFDWYSPRYQWKHTYEEVWPWFETAGLTEIRVLGSPVALQAKRPGAGTNPTVNEDRGPGRRVSRAGPVA